MHKNHQSATNRLHFATTREALMLFINKIIIHYQWNTCILNLGLVKITKLVESLTKESLQSEKDMFVEENVKMSVE